ncbi:16S rRNA (cytidine(1402)-2'-O)-methyltransferase [Mycoplasma anatis]|uniref:16S rRNA (cytidine(1402)-2'-O)-methyltransferase n=1 Tax=Mycoplasmopsis anatis TaxID=171279 RepID=UPI001C4E97FF|nr:16S rRNA (cytidine(1402)-2'-O)-methyltransferase [Mycoplasmopsis anatis]MBW0599739.1 16S rRNA (cytidine(1402)-2'-O)-methyltransferase [Mycoplasmopsis anatis]
MTNKIYIVGTPIGNMEDITLRALRILKEVDVIACEDVRVTKKLLDRYEISDKKLVTYNNFNEETSSDYLLKLYEEGSNIALVSDAGMPVMSDPGFELIKQCYENKLNIEVIPGVNAAVTAFVMSNLDNNFTFKGFIKDKTQQRVNQLKDLDYGTYIFYVSPHKLVDTLKDIYKVFSGQERLFLAKELTKMHQEFFRGNALDIIELLAKKDSIKGEYTLVINIKKPKKEKINKYADLK